MDAAMVESVYTAARAAKGNGEGTHAGYLVSNFGAYQELLVSGFDFYNECNLDYYMVAMGSNVQNLTGLSNFGVTTAYRLFNSDDNSLQNVVDTLAAYVVTADDTTAENLGKSAGNLIRIMLAVEIPTTSSTDIAYYETASKFA